MIPSSTFDPSRRLDLYFRINRASTKDFVFVDDDLADLDITGHTFTLIIKTNPGAISNVISLTLGFGLEFAVYETNVLTAEVTSSQTLIDEGEYYWELYVSDIQETWLNGKAYFHNGIFDGIDDSAITNVSQQGGSGIADLLTNTSVVTTGGTITLSFANTRDRIFYGASSFSTSKAIALSNDSNAKRLTFIFHITDTAAILTFPSSFRMSDAMWGANGAYTWQALDVGTYKAKAEFDGTLWYLDMFGPYGFIT